MDAATVAADGSYEVRTIRPGTYYVGVNLNHTATHDTPYPQWFYPGVADAGAAAEVEFSGKPETRTYDLRLPEPLPGRVLAGVVVAADGRPKPRAVVAALDASKTTIDLAHAGPDGRFTLHVFGGVPYRLFAVWPRDLTEPAVSAVPTDVTAETRPLEFRLALTEAGNAFAEKRGP